MLLFFETNIIESDNARNCDSDFSKIEEDTTKKFGQEILDVKIFFWENGPISNENEKNKQ